jgi:hypothetical protein
VSAAAGTPAASVDKPADTATTTTTANDNKPPVITINGNNPAEFFELEVADDTED